MVYEEASKRTEIACHFHVGMRMDVKTGQGKT